jgi:hypothetical protein
MRHGKAPYRGPAMYILIAILATAYILIAILATALGAMMVADNDNSRLMV